MSNRKSSLFSNVKNWFQRNCTASLIILLTLAALIGAFFLWLGLALSGVDVLSILVSSTAKLIYAIILVGVLAALSYWVCKKLN